MSFLSIAHLALISNMSLPPIPTTPAELSFLWQRAHRLVDTGFDLIKHGHHMYAAIRASVDADRPGWYNRWDFFVDLCLRRVVVNDPTWAFRRA